MPIDIKMKATNAISNQTRLQLSGGRLWKLGKIEFDINWSIGMAEIDFSTSSPKIDNN